MNVRPICLIVRKTGRNGLIDGLRMPDDVRRVRHVRDRGLFDHARMPCKAPALADGVDLMNTREAQSGDQ